MLFQGSQRGVHPLLSGAMLKMDYTLVALHEVSPGKMVNVVHLTYGRARINVGPDTFTIHDGY